MKRHVPFLGSFSLAWILGLGLFSESKVSAQGELATNPPAGFATRSDYLKSLTNEDALHKAYDRGVIGKGEAVALELMMRNRQTHNLYGKVIDQTGQPIAGVDVMGEMELMDGFVVGKNEKYKTQTDAGGLFQFVGLKGASFSARVSKSGYELGDYRVGCIAPAGGQSSPNDRVVYIMYKLHGAEPMYVTRIDSYVPCDGSVASFDLLSGNNTPKGDLIVKLTRNPINIERNKPFDWSVTFGITNGGLQEITNIYPNEAPADGYQPDVTLAFPTNMVAWKNEFSKNYYFKSKGGQTYGRIAIHIQADRPHPTTYFDAEIYANPAGSRNLEFDSHKLISK